MTRFIVIQVIALITWVFTGEVSTASGNDYLKYSRTDSAYVYKWNPEGSDWILSQVQLYSYNDGRLVSLLTRDYATRMDVARSDYTYNETGRMESATNFTFRDGWVLSTRSLSRYDVYNRVTSVRVQKWSADMWIEDRLQQNYEYDADNRLTRYESIYWRSNAWTMPTVSELFYNDRGDLETRIATRPDGNIDYRIIYEYDLRGLQTQLYTQYPDGSGWSNWNLRTIQYDGCGGKHSQIQYSGEGPDWIPSTKTVFFNSFNFGSYHGRKIPVCHKGHTIWVAVQAVPAHLRHGDCIGECLDEKDNQYGKNQVPPFTIYPNPAMESFTVRFQDDCDCQGRRIELTDFSGKLIKSYNVSDNSALVIERGKLRSGNYFVTLVGDESYSQTLIFSRPL